MKVVGLTGGIGSGKTTVARFFSELDVPVYIADLEARKLTNRSRYIRKKLIALLGEQAYKDDEINRKYVADKIFNDSKLLDQVNRIIHPRVGQHFKRWVRKQSGPYCIKEAAILFENGGYKECDYTILVTAPKKDRIARLLKRDNNTEAEILARMANQWEDTKKLSLSDYHLENTDLEATKDKVKSLHHLILKAIREA
ncbi:MAG: dephospho-CoA kinase [Bacteroidota bacterium]